MRQYPTIESVNQPQACKLFLMQCPLSPEVTALLACPVTMQPLHFAIESERAKLPSEYFPEGAFLTQDGRLAYPVRDGFPVLLASEAVAPSEN